MQLNVKLVRFCKEIKKNHFKILENHVKSKNQIVQKF